MTGVVVVAMRHSDARWAQGPRRMAEVKGELPAALKLRAWWGAAPTAGGCLEPMPTSTGYGGREQLATLQQLDEGKAATSACEMLR